MFEENNTKWWSIYIVVVIILNVICTVALKSFGIDYSPLVLGVLLGLFTYGLTNLICMKGE